MEIKIRKEIKGYWNTKCSIESYDKKIERVERQIKNMEPSTTQVYSGMPFTPSQASKTEKTAVDNVLSNINESNVSLFIELDELKNAQDNLKAIIEEVDIELMKNYLTDENRDYLRHYTENLKIDELANKYAVEDSSITRQLNRILDKIEYNYNRRIA